MAQSITPMLMRFTLQLWSTDLAKSDSVIGDGCALLTFFFFHWVWYTVARRVFGLSWQYAARIEDTLGATSTASQY